MSKSQLPEWRTLTRYLRCAGRAEADMSVAFVLAVAKTALALSTHRGA